MDEWNRREGGSVLCPLTEKETDVSVSQGDHPKSMQLLSGGTRPQVPAQPPGLSEESKSLRGLEGPGQP